MEQIEHEQIDWLQSEPGIGALSSRGLVSAIDGIDRSDNKKEVVKYAALTPRNNQNGGTHKKL